ncbi:unnamed protein product [Strongylus vulgaris]|uniref:Uncharacterized protein n=1 Tax=Strongylus vulgaris TaxID=40348 RepID=A0A3P7IPG1_STRVU|nr:unnamed protein product [Strongylus vulgaris]
MWLRQVYPLSQHKTKDGSSDTIPGKAYHFSVSESTRHAYYVGFEKYVNGGQLNTLRVIDTWKGTITTYSLPAELSSICMLYEAINGLALVGVGNDSGISVSERRFIKELRSLYLRRRIANDENMNFSVRVMKNISYGCMSSGAILAVTKGTSAAGLILCGVFKL